MMHICGCGLSEYRVCLHEKSEMILELDIVNDKVFIRSMYNFFFFHVQLTNSLINKNLCLKILGSRQHNRPHASFKSLTLKTEGKGCAVSVFIFYFLCV